VFARDTGVVTIPWSGLQWAAKHLSQDARGAVPQTAGEIVARGNSAQLLERVMALSPEAVKTESLALEDIFVSAVHEQGAVA